MGVLWISCDRDDRISFNAFLEIFVARKFLMGFFGVKFLVQRLFGGFV